MPVRCGRDCTGTEELKGFCGCVRCANCYAFISFCDTDACCEWYEERIESFVDEDKTNKERPEWWRWS
jgi:hypothetical protein